MCLHSQTTRASAQITDREDASLSTCWTQTPVRHDQPGVNPIPAIARPILRPAGTIVGLAWAPDATSIAYLLGRRVRSGNNYVVETIDLWQVRVADNTNQLVASDVASPTDRLTYRLERAIVWLGSAPAMALRRDWIPATQRVNSGVLSLDGTLVAIRESGIDSSSICIRPPQATLSDTIGPGCFGDSFFTDPVWAPY